VVLDLHGVKLSYKAPICLWTDYHVDASVFRNWSTRST